MASIANDPGGRRRILYVASDGKRSTVRLGKVSQRTAESVKWRVEQLLEALHFNRPMDADLAKWVAELEPRIAKKLSAVGLIATPEAKEAQTLGPFCEAYIGGRANLKPNTKRNYEARASCWLPISATSIPWAKSRPAMRTTGEKHCSSDSRRQPSAGK
jgi:hypothetical protein